ncbi:hypothetical protein ACOMHN_027851 [Nucella lapillus]
MKDVISDEDKVRLQFLLLEQEYLELLDDGHGVEALQCLRQMAPLKYNTDRVHHLAGCLMVSSPDDMREMAGWEGKGSVSRQQVLDNMHGSLPRNLMMPPGRLQVLMNQAADLQRQRCHFHSSAEDNDPNSIGLLTDHQCHPDQFPGYNIQTLDDHKDEVWYCAFSPNGRLLATGCKDGNLNIYYVNLETYAVHCLMIFKNHPKGVSFVAWSPDNSHLIVCGPDVPRDPDLWIYSMEKRGLHARMHNSQEVSLSCAAWLPDSRRFIAGGTLGHFFLCDIDGIVLKSLEGVRVQGLVTVPDSDLVLVLDSQNRVRGYKIEEDTITNYTVFKEDYPVISLCLNKTGRLALVNVANQGVHLWDTHDRVLVRKYQGMSHGQFVTYSTFGGANEDFIACGSEDPTVYIFHVRSSHAVIELKGHSRSVSCVDWNPRLPNMLASASDDGTVRIWGPQSKVQPVANSAL